MKQSYRVNVRLLRSVIRGLKGDVPLRIKVAGQSCDDYLPIYAVQATKDYIMLVVDGMGE